MAILAALASPDELEVLAITAVAGNVPLDLTVTNSLALVELADRPDVPVYRGSVRPMVSESGVGQKVHTAKPSPSRMIGKAPNTLSASELSAR